ncbi:MAG: AAA family ATPase [Kiritimatiellae bacterium]|nr:AAA family ATPase [Kiritimatiellia bacterium]
MSDNLLRLTKLEMSNFRCFRKMDKPIEFDPNLTVIVAKNGCGKTAVLDAIRISLGTFTKGMDHSQAGIRWQDASLTPLRAGLKGQDYPVSIKVDGMVDSRLCHWERVRGSQDGRTTTKDAQVISDFGSRLREGVISDGCEMPELPILAFYGTGRLWKGEAERIKERMQDKPAPAFESCFAGYEDALTANSIYAQVKHWMKGADLCRNNPAEQETALGRSTAAQYKAVESAVEMVLEATKTQLGKLRTPHYNSQYDEMALIDGRRGNDSAIAVPISWTSDGVKAAFSLVADIAYRCARLNPAFGEEACQKTQGIVMIDEVDLFLHPAWQQRILPDLRRIFPRIQFVVTTHSPQVVSSVPPECIRIVDDNGKAEPARTWTEGVESSRILKDVFGADPYAPKTLNNLRQRVDAFVDAVNAGRWNDPEIKEEGEKLGRMYTGVDSNFDMARFRIEEEDWERDHASH